MTAFVITVWPWGVSQWRHYRGVITPPRLFLAPTKLGCQAAAELPGSQRAGSFGHVQGQTVGDRGRRSHLLPPCCLFLTAGFLYLLLVRHTQHRRQKNALPGEL